MNDGGRWRRVYSLEWHAGAFQGLTDAERVVYFYAKTGPQSTSVGIYRVSTALAVEDIGGPMTPIEFDHRLDVVCRAFDWRFDPTTRVLWMPNWVAENPPQSPNVCVSWRKLLANLPDCELKVEAATFIVQALKDFPEAFQKAIGKDFLKDLLSSKAKPKAKPEAYQGAGDQRIQRSGNRGTGAGAETRGARVNHASVNGGPPSRLVKLAKETLQIVSPTLPLPELVDVFQAQHKNTRATRPEIEQAFYDTGMLG